MSFRDIIRDVRDSFGSLSMRSSDGRLSRISSLKLHRRGKSQAAVHELHHGIFLTPQSRWANLPPELLHEVVRRLEESETSWPSRKHVVACAAVCRSWRAMCKDVVLSPEFSGKLTFPLSLKQPGPRVGNIQCFIKRDKSKQTYHLYLCLSPALLVETGKFLMSAKRIRRTTHSEYVISMDSSNISRSSGNYVGKMRSNFLGMKFLIYDTQPLPIGPSRSAVHRRSFSRKVSPNTSMGNYRIGQVSYELNVLGNRGPRRIQCVMHSIPASALDDQGRVTAPSLPEQLVPSPLDESFRSIGSSSMVSALFSDAIPSEHSPLVLRNKVPRWHEQLQCWCLNFRGRVTVASVKNFQLIAATHPTAEPATELQPPPSSSSSRFDHDKIILQFGKVAKDMFTMDYRYPLSAFQAFAICLTSFDTKLACE